MKPRPLHPDMVRDLERLLVESLQLSDEELTVFTNLLRQVNRLLTEERKRRKDRQRQQTLHRAAEAPEPQARNTKEGDS